VLALLLGGAAAGATDTAPESHRVETQAVTSSLRVCYYEFEPLVSRGADGKPRGLYIDLLEHVAREEAWRLEYVHGTWDECLRSLAEARVDLVPVVGYSEERAKTLAFNAEFPVLDWGVVFTRDGSPIRTIFDLRGKRIGVLRGSIYTQGFRALLEQFGIDAAIVEKGDYHGVFAALERGELDAGINAQLSGAAIAPQYRLQPTQIYFSPVRLAFAAPRVQSGVLRALDAHFAALKAKPGSLWYELFARWMPGSSTTRAPRWLVPVLGSAAALLVISIAFAWVLRRQVAARTAALRTANAQLRESEALLRTFSDAIPDPIFLKDRQGRWLFANPAARSVVGRSPGAVLGRTDGEIHDDPAIGAALMETDERIMASGVAEVVEETIETPAGYRVYLSTKVPYRDQDGRVIGIIGSARDISERIRAEEALRESEHRFRSLNERASDIVLVTDRQGIITFASPSLARVTGLAPADVLGGSCFDAVHPDDLARMRQSFGLVAADPAVRREDELRIRRADGRWLLMRAETGNLLDVPSVHGIVINSRDITEQRHAEEQLRQAQKLESIGRLAGGVAHDFNNLLTVILSCADALQDDFRAGAPVKLEEIQEIRAAGERASGLTRQLLAFARKQVIAPVPLDLNAVVRDSEKLLRRVLDADVDLVVTLHPGLWSAHCDPGQIGQVILNLVVNARDAMPRGGRLAIETTNAVIDEDHVARYPGERPGDYVRLVIRDSGTGMSPEVKSHLFEPFFTTKAPGRGTGLGLATVYGIVKQSDGYAHVASEPGEGTAVEIWLPRTRDVAATVAPPRAPAEQRGTERLLVVEDDPHVREVTVRSLRGGGYEVLVAASGQEALAFGAERLRQVRLLVTDVVMPGLDGRALASELLRRHPALRVLYVSGYPQDAIAERGVLMAGVELLPKPFTASALLARVRAVLDVR
jgi:two-component system, cell cycle sensor histidine kinase and response regulator CckA